MSSATSRPGAGRGQGLAGGVAMLAFTAAIWGAQFPIAKSAFEHVDAFHLTIMRFGLPLLVLLAILVWKEGWVTLRFDRLARDATLYGFIGMCGSPALIFGGLMLTRPEVAAIIVATQPSTTAVALWLVRGQRPGAFSLACIVVAFFGVVTVVTRWGLAIAPTPDELIGFALIFSGTICWVAYTMATDRFRGWSILRLTTLTMLPGVLGNIALAVALTGFGLIRTPTADDWSSVVWEMLFLAVFGVLAAMLLWNAGTQRIGAMNAMLFINLIPVVAFAVRYVQGYRFHPIEVVGAALVIGALVANNLALRRRHRHLTVR